MKKIIHNLKQKNQREKEKIAFFGAFFVTLLIVFVWAMGVTTFNNVEETQVANSGSPINNAVEDFLSIFEQYKK